MLTSRNSPNYGKGQYELPDDTPDLEAEAAALQRWLDGYLKSPSCASLPRPPAVALEILAMSRKPNAHIEDIAKLLEREPLLAGRVLKLSNSPLYAGASPCVTLKQALVRMGLSLVRDVVMEAAMQMTYLRADGFNATLESIRRHSSATAWVSRFVARNTSIEAENAFLLGLLHDVGLSVGVLAAFQYLRAQRKPLVLTPLTWMAVETVHERFSGDVLRMWGLPESLSLVVSNHHTLVVHGMPHPQVAVLMVAEQLINDAGWAVQATVEQSTDTCTFLPSARETCDREQIQKALAVISLDEQHYKMISQDMERVLETLKAQFDAAARQANG